MSWGVAYGDVRAVVLGRLAQIDARIEQLSRRLAVIEEKIEAATAKRDNVSMALDAWLCR